MSKSRPYLLSPFQEKYDYFCSISAIFCEKNCMVICSKVGMKVSHTLLHSCNFWASSSEKILVPTLYSFVAINHKGHFSKILSKILKFGCFSRNHAQIFDKNEFDIMMQKLMLNLLAPI